LACGRGGAGERIIEQVFDPDEGRTGGAANRRRRVCKDGDMRVDRLTEDDWERLRDTRLRALATDGAAYGSSLEREQGFKESHWRMRLRASPWFVVVVREQTVGLVGVISEPGAPAQERHLVGLWVSPEHRGVGVGDALLAAAQSWADDDGAALLSLWLLDGNAAAERMYRRAGYAPTGVRMPMPRDRSLTEERWTKLLGGEKLGGPLGESSEPS
jgi:GNAT superfamily N-acetyltransferase